MSSNEIYAKILTKHFHGTGEKSIPFDKLIEEIEKEVGWTHRILEFIKINETHLLSVLSIIRWFPVILDYNKQYSDNSLHQANTWAYNQSWKTLAIPSITDGKKAVKENRLYVLATNGIDSIKLTDLDQKICKSDLYIDNGFFYMRCGKLPKCPWFVVLSPWE